MVVVLLLASLSVVVASPALAACASPANPVLCENTLAGSPASEWDISGIGDAGLQGFATDISVNKGETVNFKVDTAASQWHANIYRLGYYGGSGARLVGQTATAGPQNQPACMSDPTTGLVDCGNWGTSLSWDVPATAVSGVYIAGLVASADPTAKGSSSHIVFIVRDDGSHSKLLFQTSDTTWQAYNEYGGNSLYTGSPVGRALKVSYNRPFITRGGVTAEDWLFNSEYPMIRWLEANGYDVSYTTGTDSDRRGGLIRNHQSFLSVGHDEYWSGGQRSNVEAARAAGVNLAFFSGNEVVWKTRWEPSISSPATDYRTLVTYKETHGDAVDPDPAWTGTWRDDRAFNPDGPKPENALTGQLFMVNEGTTAIQVPAAQGKQPFWRHTSVANLAAGQTATLPAGTLGYEWDVDVNNGSRPAGLVHLSSTTVSVPSLLQDNGSTYAPGTATHTLTLYRAASGALVFGAGTIQWSWGLDSNHDRGNDTADVRMQQATLNLLADMGSQPGSVQPGLVTDSPTSTTTTTTISPTTTTTAPPVVVLGASARSGYWMVGTDGKVYPFGDAKDLGNPSASLGGV
ncbi:MAG: hypothetical protein QOD57_1986, partial [Actinomycetota bacterium]|nr:hypothetical protein [Actinomycetota bacterium]